MENEDKFTLIKADVSVIGGGMAGMCAAISAARGGAQVVLIQNRSVLGGNQSSEIRVGLCGADDSGFALAQYVRETGLIEELWLERMHRVSDYDTGYYIQDVVFWEAIKKNPNIRLLLNTQAYQVELGADGQIEAVIAGQSTTEKNYRIQAKIYIDASGDSLIAAKAGAVFRVGREAKHEFNESMAPDTADNRTMGSSAVFRASKKNHKVEYKRPDWAYDFSDTKTFPISSTWLEYYGDMESFAGYWWLELGGDRDTIADAEEIRDDLYKTVFGMWDHLKNHGDYGCDNFDITWLTTVPGKRESRRIEGDYVVSENDVKGSVLFDDRVAYGGWPIDIHPPKGIFSSEPPCVQIMLDDVWSIPFRSLYSRNVPNLMMAGRNISTTHVAMGSSRVMATCALTGQAVGTAAGLCIRYGKSPRELGRENMTELQQTLLRDDCYIKDIRNIDAGDMARGAAVYASSRQRLCMDRTEKAFPLHKTTAQLIPVSGGRIDRIELMLESREEKKIVLKVYRASRINSLPEERELAASAEAMLQARKAAWVGFDFHINDGQDSLYWLLLDSDDDLCWYGTELNRPVGTRAVSFSSNDGKWMPRKGYFGVRLTPESYPYSAENILNGVTRPEKWTNLWISDENEALPQTVELVFDQAKPVAEIRVTFDTALDKNLYLVSDCSNESEYLTSCVRDYDIYGFCDGEWIKLHSERDNYQRHKIHSIKPRYLEKLKIRVLRTYGDASAKIYEIRCY